MKRPNQRRAVRVVGGARFVSGGDGHYYSTDGRFAIFHMLRGTPESAWEIHAIDKERRSLKCLYDEAWLALLVAQFKFGGAKLPPGDATLGPCDKVGCHARASTVELEQGHGAERFPSALCPKHARHPDNLGTHEKPTIVRID